MQIAESKIAFWCLVLIQMLCAQSILWSGLPVYKKLLHGRMNDATTSEILVATLAVLVMQVSYWIAFQIQPHLHFRRQVFLAHVLICIGDLSFLFPSTLAAVAIFDNSINLEQEWWKLLLLVTIIFAMYCYKLQLQSLGTLLLEAKKETTER